jgi:hypothetical protein
LIQQEYFNVVKAVPSFLTHLSPFVDKNGVLRVGGRLSNTPLDDSCKHPVILPKKGGERIIEWYHSEVHHSGRTATVNALRQNGFWLLSVNAQVRKIIYNCFRCRFIRRKLSVQLYIIFLTWAFTLNSQNPFCLKAFTVAVRPEWCTSE